MRRWRLHTWVAGAACWAMVGSLCVGRVVTAQQTTVAARSMGDEAREMQEMLARRVTITLTDVSRAAAIDSISQVAKVLVQYRARVLDTGSPIRVHAVAQPLGTLLEQVLEGTGLRVVFDGHQKLYVTPIRDTVAQNAVPSGGIVAGRVIDSASGHGLDGATVKIQGTKIAATTTKTGSFVLRDVPPGDQVLSVRVFGYRSVTRMVAARANEQVTVRIVVTSVPTVLSGVVTTATGAQRKIEVGNDITTLNVDSIMQRAPVSTVTDLLETRVPGLTVLHSSGEPGSPSRLRLRGVGSISGNNDPIVIVDGVRVYANQSDPRNDNLAPDAGLTYSRTVNGTGTQSIQQRSGFAAPSPIDQIDPNSIETIEVFKGPSASALYGSDAANGVIVITTKRGRAGPTKWSLALQQGINWIPGNWPENYFRFGYNAHGYGPLCNWYDPTCVQIDSLRSYQSLNDPQYTVLGRGSDQTANLSIQGGTPTLQYSVTGNVGGTQGNLKLPAAEQQHYTSLYGAIPRWMVRPDQYKTWGVDASATAQPTQNLHVTLQSSLFSSMQQTSSLQSALTQLEGVYISGGVMTAYDGTTVSLATHPLVNNYIQRVTDDQVTNREGLTLAWQPLPWLPITGTGGLETVQRTDNTYIPFGLAFVSSGSAGDTAGYYGLGRGLTRNQTLNVGTTIPLLGQRVSLSIGGNYYSGTINDFRAFTKQLSPGVSSPNTFFSPNCSKTGYEPRCGADQSSNSSATYGYYLEPRLSFKSRFFVAPGFRLDGGSGGSHASTNGGGAGGLSAFPKLDFSYVAVDRQSERPLWGILSLLRPRLAFGLAGTQPSPEQRLRLFNVGTGYALNVGGQGSLISNINNITGCSPSLSLDGTTTVQAACISTLGNTQLHPERSRELEGGFEATLWNGRLGMTFTQYNRTRTDAIVAIPVAPSVSQAGGNSFTIARNIGEIRNTGTELSITAVLWERRAFSWNVGANVSNDNNVLVHLNPGQAPSYDLGLVPGYPLFSQWIKPITGFSDRDGNEMITSDEIVFGDSLVYAGQPNPKYQLNLNTDVHLFDGRLGVYATFAYQNGLTQTNQAALQSAAFNLIGNNPETSLAYQAAALAAGGTPNYPGIKTPYGLMQTVNTFRFNALSINYEVPKTFSDQLRVPRVTVALQGSNLALHSNYRGKDPNVNAFTTVSAGDQTSDLGQIPEPRLWRVRFTLGN